MLKVAVFDSSTIELPQTIRSARVADPSQLPSSSWKANPLTGRNRPLKPSEDENAVKPNPTPVEGTGGASKKENDEINGEGLLHDHDRANPGKSMANGVSVKKTNDAISKKWAEPITDARDTRIKKALASRRSQKSGCSKDGSEATVSTGRSSMLSANDSVVDDKIITYPKFIVIDDSTQGTKMGLLKGRSLKKGPVVGDVNKKVRRPKAYSEDDIEIGEPEDEIKRNSKLRKSLREPPQRVNKTRHGHPLSYKNKQFRSMDNLQQTCDTNGMIFGLFPEEMEGHLKGKVVASQESVILSPQRMSSPNVYQPPPTPSSALFASIALNQKSYTMYEQSILEAPFGNRKKGPWAKRGKDVDRPKKEGADVGVSNTTHLLMERKVKKHVFTFPELRRKHSETSTGVGKSKEETHTARSKCDSEELSAGEGKRDHKSSDVLELRRAKTYAGPEPVNGGLVKLPNEKIPRMVTLGLPRVNINIDKNYFSKQNIQRRSLKLREMYDLKNSQGENGKVQVQNRTTLVQAETTEHSHVNDEGTMFEHFVHMNGDLSDRQRDLDWFARNDDTAKHHTVVKSRDLEHSGVSNQGTRHAEKSKTLSNGELEESIQQRSDIPKSFSAAPEQKSGVVSFRMQLPKEQRL